MKTLAALYKVPTFLPEKIPELIDIIKDSLKEEGYEFQQDEKNNLYCVHPDSKQQTLLCAHMDMVKTGEPVDRVVQFNGILFGIDKDNNLTSCGMDDKNGVWIAIKIAKKMKKNKPALLFVAHEEGAPHTIEDWIANNEDELAKYTNCLVLDRTGKNEIIYSGAFKAYSKVLAMQFKKINPEWEFKKGVACDADRLIAKIPCINLSIGYYNGHKKTEHSIYSEIKYSFDAVLKFLQANDIEKNFIDWEVARQIDKL